MSALQCHAKQPKDALQQQVAESIAAVNGQKAALALTVG
jgi:hypothetical protein